MPLSEKGKARPSRCEQSRQICLAGALLLAAAISSSAQGPALPAPTPKGRIAFAACRGGNWDVYSVAAGGDLRRLITHPAHDRDPAWSPDGQKIAFSSRRGGGDSSGMPRGSPLANVAPQVGDTALDFVMTYPDGRQVKLSDLRGKPVLVNFWAAWCPPCRAEMPAIEAAYRQRGFVVLAVNIGESASKVTGFVEQFDLTFPVVLDNKWETALVYRVRAIPSSFFIDGKGVIINRHLEPMSTQVIEAYLLQVLP